MLVLEVIFSGLSAMLAVPKPEEQAVVNYLSRTGPRLCDREKSYIHWKHFIGTEAGI